MNGDHQDSDILASFCLFFKCSCPYPLDNVQLPNSNRLVPVGRFPSGDSVGGQISNLFNTDIIASILMPIP